MLYCKAHFDWWVFHYWMKNLHGNCILLLFKQVLFPKENITLLFASPLKFVELSSSAFDLVQCKPSAGFTAWPHFAMDGKSILLRPQECMMLVYIGVLMPPIPICCNPRHLVHRGHRHRWIPPQACSRFGLTSSLPSVECVFVAWLAGWTLLRPALLKPLPFKIMQRPVHDSTCSLAYLCLQTLFI